MAQHKLYALVLTGQGDTEIKLVDKDMWDWIDSAQPKAPVPDNILVQLRKHHEDEKFVPHISRSTAVNDAALMAAPVEIDGAEAMFFSIRDFNKFVRKYDIEIVEEFEGCIY
jgi:hypothetical protein